MEKNDQPNVVDLLKNLRKTFVERIHQYLYPCNVFSPDTTAIYKVRSYITVIYLLQSVLHKKFLRPWDVQRSLGYRARHVPRPATISELPRSSDIAFILRILT